MTTLLPASVILLDTDEASKIYLKDDKLYQSPAGLTRDKDQRKNLYFISTTPLSNEDIDIHICIFISSNNLITCLAGNKLGRVKTPGNYYKIIASTSKQFEWPQPSPEFISYYINQYNKNIFVKIVNIECNRTPDGIFYHNEVPYSSIKIDDNNHIIINNIEIDIEELAKNISNKEVPILSNGTLSSERTNYKEGIKLGVKLGYVAAKLTQSSLKELCNQNFILKNEITELLKQAYHIGAKEYQTSPQNIKEFLEKNNLPDSFIQQNL